MLLGKCNMNNHHRFHYILIGNLIGGYKKTFFENVDVYLTSNQQMVTLIKIKYLIKNNYSK